MSTSLRGLPFPGVSGVRARVSWPVRVQRACLSPGGQRHSCYSVLPSTVMLAPEFKWTPPSAPIALLVMTR